MARPATASAPPRTADAWSSPPNAFEVRYTVKTNVVMTALKAAEPQSQDAQARTRPLLVAWFPASSSEDGCVAPGALALFIRCIVSADGEQAADFEPVMPGHAGGRIQHGGRKRMRSLDKLAPPEPNQ
jgi:hypothetical protein